MARAIPAWTWRWIVGAGLVLASACSRSPSNPVAPTSPSSIGGQNAIVSNAAAHSESGFGVIATDVSRCFQFASDPNCFSANRVRAQAIGAAATAPTAPTNLIASASGSTVTLIWGAPTSGDPVAAYVIEAGSASGLANLANFSTGNTATAFSAGGVGAGTYYVRVRAVNTSGTSAASNESILVVGSGPCPGAPGAPSGLQIVLNTGGTVTLSWAPAAGSPTSYIIEAGSAPGLANLANSDLGGSTSMTATGVGAGTYYVRVRAKNACGTSAPSNEMVLAVVSATPCGVGAPSSLSASIAGTTVVYRWSSPTGTAPSSYVLEAGTAAGLTNAAVVDLGTVATTFTATNVAVGTYFVRFRSKTACGLSGPSNEIVITVSGAGNLQAFLDIITYNQDALPGSSYRRLGIISRWEQPIPIYVDPSASVANVDRAMAYWQSVTGLSYVIVSSNTEPRILVRGGTDGLGAASGRGLVDGTYADNRARSGLVVISPDLATGNFSQAGFVYEHELGHAIGMFDHVAGGGIMSGGTQASGREINMLIQLYRLPYGAHVAPDGTWQVSPR